MLDEIERSVHDALCSVKRVLESKSLVVGGGCVEVATAVHLDEYARTLVNTFFINIMMVGKQRTTCSCGILRGT